MSYIAELYKTPQERELYYFFQRGADYEESNASEVMDRRLSCGENYYEADEYGMDD